MITDEASEAVKADVLEGPDHPSIIAALASFGSLERITPEFQVQFTMPDPKTGSDIVIPRIVGVRLFVRSLDHAGKAPHILILKGRGCSMCDEPERDAWYPTDDGSEYEMFYNPRKGKGTAMFSGDPYPKKR